jgi:hypothetical protein
VRVAGDADVVEHSEIAKEADVLESAGDAAVRDGARTATGDGFAVKENVALGRGVDAGDDVERGGFARPVGADDAVGMSRGDIEGKIGKGNEAAEAHGHAAHL